MSGCYTWKWKFQLSVGSKPQLPRWGFLSPDRCFVLYAYGLYPSEGSAPNHDYCGCLGENPVHKLGF